MRERDTLRDVPVIVLTGKTLTKADMLELQEGIAAVLNKGLFSTAEVLAQVEAALSRTKRLGDPAQRVVRQALAYIHEHYAEPITREELARQGAISEGYLTRRFHQEMGVTPVMYLNRYRVKVAKAMLERGDKSVTDIALAVGFADSSYFSRVFRQEVGISPQRLPAR